MSRNTVTITDTSLSVEPHGLDKIWSYTSRLEFPLAHVRGATHDPGLRHEPKGGAPRYGKRLSPEELEAYLYEQRVQSPAEPPPNSDWSSESRASSYGASADEAREGRKKEGRENKEGSESDPFVRASGGSAVRLADPLPPVSESAALGYTGYAGFGTGFGTRPRTVRRPWRMSVIGLVLATFLLEGGRWLRDVVVARGLRAPGDG